MLQYLAPDALARRWLAGAAFPPDVESASARGRLSALWRRDEVFTVLVLSWMIGECQQVADRNAFRVRRGAVTVFYGRSGVVLTGEQFWHQNSYGVEDKIEPLDHFGGALSAGDYNADGLADLAIGVYSEDIGSIPNVGAVNVITGSSIGLHSGADCLLLPAIRYQDGFFGLFLAH